MREAFLGTLDYEVDTLQLLAEYRELVLRQGQWHATGSTQARTQWSAALERYRALAASHLDRYQGDVDHPAYNLTAAELGIARSERDPAMAWLARGLLALALGWLVAGARARVPPSRRARRARRPPRHWLAATRPWRAAEVGPGMPRAQRALLVAVPGALLLATRARADLVPRPGAPARRARRVARAARRRLGAAARPGAVGSRRGRRRRARGALRPGPARDVVDRPRRLLVRVLDRAGAGAPSTSPSPWRCSCGCSSRPAWALSVTAGRRRAAGTVLAAVGAGLAVPASVSALVGLERALTAWNDQVGLLPWGLSRILGITVYLGIPADTAWWAAGLGAVLLVVGLLLALPWWSAAPATEDAAEHVADDAAGVEAGR